MRPSRFALFLLPALLAACAAPAPPPPPAAPLRASGDLRERVVGAALAEWESWGKLVLTGWEPVLDGGAVADPGNFSRILGYWDTVPEGAGVATRHQTTHDALIASLEESGVVPAPEPAIALWANPAWSAAFISFVMRSAGVSEGDFPPAAAHATYVDSLLSRVSFDPEGAPFRPHAPEERAPQPGDLLCADRSRSPLYGWTERLGEPGQFRPMHCDVVISGGPGVVQAIGGNVRDVVALRRLPADSQGRVLPAPPGESVFFVVFENRLGRRPGA
ncbi:DUF2272 domain-containing protein [Roseomonas sp. BN140053]|uniref:DUF2272 domain-containing protein n=1 Tax=Roseomonas sp. BN140053 TaxID=3391898 RepID=UPI0039ECD124